MNFLAGSHQGCRPILVLGRIYSCFTLLSHCFTFYLQNIFFAKKQGFYNPAGTDPAGQTLHGDHAYVFYQIPKKARKLPLMLWHGHLQLGKTWETTPDGREGFQNIFLRRNFPVYLIDQPRRGRGGRSSKDITITASPDEQLWYGIFRLGVYPGLYPGVQFSKDPEALNQFFRQSVANTGPYDMEVNVNAVSALFDKIGDGILVTHSQSGVQGWKAVIKNAKIKAVVAYEPGALFFFPEGELPEPMTHLGGTVNPGTVTKEEFLKFTKIPVVIYFGDNIADKPTTNPGQDQWRVALAMARKWCDLVNKYGGDAHVVHLPEIGIKGNTHFPMSDLNNVEIADLLSQWLKEKKLD